MDRDNIPEYIRGVLTEVFTDEGIHRWWNARIKVLDDQRPRDLIDTSDGPERIYALANALADGMFA